MISRHFAVDAINELRARKACEIKDRGATERILGQLIRSSIAHARNQIEGRNRGTMTFDEAMGLIRTGDAMVTRPSWSIFCAVATNDGSDDEEKSIFFYRLDNCDGTLTGNGWPYNPTDEDRAATDWMSYQAPQDNWIELDF